MSTADSIKSKLQSLLSLINQTTNEQDTTLTTAINRIVNEYTTGQTNKIVIDKDNLHNSETDVADNYYSNGVLTTYSNRSATQLIPIEEGSIYAFTTTANTSVDGTYIPLFNEDKTFSKNIKGAIGTLTGKSYTLFEAPQTGYIAFSGTTASITNLSMHRCTGKIVVEE